MPDPKPDPSEPVTATSATATRLSGRSLTPALVTDHAQDRYLEVSIPKGAWVYTLLGPSRGYPQASARRRPDGAGPLYELGRFAEAAALNRSVLQASPVTTRQDGTSCGCSSMWV